MNQHLWSLFPAPAPSGSERRNFQLLNLYCSYCVAFPGYVLLLCNVSPWSLASIIEWLAGQLSFVSAWVAQLAGWPRVHSGFDCLKRAARGGPKECYRGIGPALALTPHSAIQIAVYEHLKSSQ